jgi:hypothetical protein
VFEDVAVVHVAPAVRREANGDLDELVGVDADGVLEAALVVVDRMVELVVGVALELDGCGEVALVASDPQSRDAGVDVELGDAMTWSWYRSSAARWSIG